MSAYSLFLRSTAALALVLFFSCDMLPEPEEIRTGLIGSESLSALQRRRDELYAWAPRCEDGTMSERPTECVQADATKMNGLICLAGTLAGDSRAENYCEAVRRSQTPDGRWWRGPSLAGIEVEDSFSRDMMLGVLAYMVAKKDKAAFERWVAWIYSNGNRMCKESSNNRCDITATSWGLWFVVMESLGYDVEALYQDPNIPSDHPYKKARDGRYSSVVALPGKASSAPIGFELELVTEGIFIRQSAGESNSVLQQALETASSRQPENLYFELLAKGPSESLVTRTLKACPAKMPRNPDGTLLVFPQWYSWLWQMDTAHWADLNGVTASTPQWFTQPIANDDGWPPWSHVNGHDCIYLIDHLLHRAKD
jgi:hypothetical protein